MAKVKLALKEAGIEAESLKGEPRSFLPFPFFPARSLSLSLLVASLFVLLFTLFISSLFHY